MEAGGVRGEERAGGTNRDAAFDDDAAAWLSVLADDADSAGDVLEVDGAVFLEGCGDSDEEVRAANERRGIGR